MTKLILPPQINEALQQFVPESYQWPVINAIEKDHKKSILLVWNRRAGKDITALNIIIREALRRRGSYLYMLPQQKQARQVVFNGMTYEGKPLLSYIPDALIARKLQNEMTIHLVNGSIIYFCGSNYYNNYRGISPMGLVLSEAAYSHPEALPTFIPALERNNALTLLISTPFGENWFYDLYKSTEKSDHWFTQRLTVDDTKTFTREQIDQQIADSKISYEMAQQEFFCSFSIGASGSFYSYYLNQMYLNEQIGSIPWDRGKQVMTSWDIGVNDQCCILFFQIDNNRINIIDMYVNSNLGMDHYIQYLKEKPYNYGTHLWPHDGRHREKSTAEHLDDIARSMGLNPVILERSSIHAGIEKTRTMLSRIFIDENKCRPLIKALRDYRKEFDTLLKRYKDKPLHDENSDIADALRTLTMGYDKIKGRGMTAEEARKLKQDALYGDQQSPNIPYRFSEHLDTFKGY